MLTEEKIKELKEKHGSIYKITLGGKDYVYRPLLRGEFKEIQASVLDGATEMDPAYASDMEEAMLRKCVVFPEDEIEIDKLPAGVPSALSSYISEVSGFNADSEPIEL